MVIIARELAVTVLRMGATQAGVIMPASNFGKLKTCVQIAAILSVIAVHSHPLWLELLVYAAVVITVASGLDYFFGLRRRIDEARASDATHAS
jgi:CDP-diacylglycerol--glycerol-3-phosphate 3-phosphatidyltransferase